MKIGKLATIVGGIGLVGAVLLSGPTRKVACTEYINTMNIDTNDGEQWVNFNSGTYDAGIGFSPDKLVRGRDYELTLKKYLIGLGRESIIKAIECRSAGTSENQ